MLASSPSPLLLLEPLLLLPELDELSDDEEDSSSFSSPEAMPAPLTGSTAASLGSPEKSSSNGVGIERSWA
jgi:hypothetical protein